MKFQKKKNISLHKQFYTLLGTVSKILKDAKIPTNSP